MQRENLDLRDNWGEDHLASALGVDTAVVGGLWKKLKAVDEKSRASRLVEIAAELAIALSENGSSTEAEDALAAKHRLSPRVVRPLVHYYESRYAVRSGWYS